MNLTKLSQQFKNFTEMVNRFKTDAPKWSQIEREVHHTISEYKRSTDDVRKAVNAMGIYSNADFDSIFFYKLNHKLSVAFVIANRSGELVITVGMIKNTVRFPEAKKITLTYDSYKTAINAFNREVRSLGTDINNKHSILKFENLFLSHFIVGGVSSVDTRFKIEYAQPILEVACAKELKAFDSAHRSYVRASNKSTNTFTEINNKVEAYRKQLKEEAKYDELHKKGVQARVKMEKVRGALRTKLETEYAKDTRFTFSFPFDTVKKAFKKVF